MDRMTVFSVVFLGALAGLYLVEPVASLGHFAARNYNEGWNAYWAHAAVDGAPLYPPPGATVSNNYPPLGFFLVGYLAHWLGDFIVVGRLVGLVSFLIVAINAWLWLRLNDVSRYHATAVVAALVAAICGFAPWYIGANDPQWLAHALMATGLVLLWKDSASSYRLMAALVLVMLGGWVKPLLVPLPLALTAGLYWQARRSFWLWVAGGSVLMAGLSTAALMLFGHDFLTDVFAAPRVLSIKRPLPTILGAVIRLLPVLALAPFGTIRWRPSVAERFVCVYGASAVAVAAIASAGSGVAENAFFDVALAGALGSGLALKRLSGRAVNIGRLAVDAAALGVIAVAGLVLLEAPWAIGHAGRRLGALEARTESTRQDVEFLRTHGPERAACENLALCYWAGAPFNVDFFNFGQKLKSGMVATLECERLFDGHTTRLIQLEERPGPFESRLPAACNEAIDANYVVVRESHNGVLMVPRNAQRAIGSPRVGA